MVAREARSLIGRSRMVSEGDNKAVAIRKESLRQFSGLRQPVEEGLGAMPASCNR